VLSAQLSGEVERGRSSKIIGQGKVVRPGGFELPAFWFVANGVKMINALFGVAYELETPFFPHLAAPNSAPKTEMYRSLRVSSTRLAEFRLRRRDFEQPISWSRTVGQIH
jgi:hypothetical protein